ncbi:hypothetical protein ACIBG7_31565 [Nonomuraea sp. NPDC050328]|uniref:CysS/YqeB C-terminal domain-containing protein n=1 Tax=Nonomuraea sp. NPDC050328 TaxID=3364361 RepID=UPI0037A9EA79
MSEAPRHVSELAERRAKARAERDYASADALRAEIESAGWVVHDTADGFALSERPAYEVWPSVRSIPVSAMTEDEPAGHLPPPAVRTTGTGRDTEGGSSRTATGSRPDVGAGAATPEHDGDPALRGRSDGAPARQGAEERPAEDLGFAGGPPAKVPDDDLLHAQRLWDGSIAANRLDDAGVAMTRRRTEVAEVTVSVGLVVDGWPDDLRTCVESIIEHTTARVLLLDLGNVDGAGDAAQELAERHPGRITVWHVAEQPHWRGGTAEWGACRTKLLYLDEADVHVLMETSTVFTGDAITPLVDALKSGAVAAGWKGVEPSADGHDWHEAGPGPVRALLGYLMAVRRSAALTAFPDGARYYRNADLEFSLALPGELVVPDELLPVVQGTHRAYHEVDPGYRDRESRRTYDRVLRLLRTT